MESLIVHPKNQMELNALKSTLKDMGIRFEKFHTRAASEGNPPARKHQTAPKAQSQPRPTQPNHGTDTQRIKNIKRH